MTELFVCNSLEDFNAAAKELISKFSENRKFAFYGEMGVGKTTFIKSICSQLSVKDNVTSPTFSLVNVYLNKNKEELYHFDFYRIKNIEEAYDIGYEEYFYNNNNYCFIEWPEIIEELLPKEIVRICIENKDNIRTINYL